MIALSSEVDETAHLLFEAVYIVLDGLLGHHLSHIGLAGRVTDHCCAAADEDNGLVACHLETFHQAQRHKMANVQAVCGGVKTDVEGCLSGVHQFFDLFLVGHLGDETPSFQFFKYCHVFPSFPGGIEKPSGNDFSRGRCFHRGTTSIYRKGSRLSDLKDAVTGVPGSPYAQKFQKTCSQVYSLRRRSSVPPSRRLSVPAQMQILLLFHAFHNVFIIPYCPAVVKGFFCKKSGQPLDKAKEIVYHRNRKSVLETVRSQLLSY